MATRTPHTADSRAAPKRFAVIDLGSNSWRLVVFTYGEGWWRHSDELYEAVRIGEGIDHSGRLSEAAIRRGLDTLAIFQRFCQAEGLTPADVHVFATSAIRDATNQAEFLARAGEISSYEINVLSAQQEAHYGYVAAIDSSTLIDGVTLDIGGGSMQLVRVEDRAERELVSLPLGAVRMTEHFLAKDPTHPARKRDLQKLREHVETELDAAAPWLRDSKSRLVATGGAVRNLAAAGQRLEFGAAMPPELGVQGYVLKSSTLSELVRRLAELPVGERKTIRGIKEGRGDIILASAVTLEAVMKVGRIDAMEVTESGLRDGIFLARAYLSEVDPLLADVRRSSVTNLALQSEPNLAHAEHVAKLALQMHASLREAKVIRPKPGEEQLLWAAAMLHDIGMAISYDDHHKHSHYMITTTPLAGFDPRERALIAQTARYHRKGVAKLGVWSKLGQRGDDALVARCAIILRLAEHLERGHDQSVSSVRLEPETGGSAIRLLGEGDLSLPRWSVSRYNDDEAFERTFGRKLLIDGREHDV